MVSYPYGLNFLIIAMFVMSSQNGVKQDNFDRMHADTRMQ